MLSEISLFCRLAQTGTLARRSAKTLGKPHYHDCRLKWRFRWSQLPPPFCLRQVLAKYSKLHDVRHQHIRDPRISLSHCGCCGASCVCRAGGVRRRNRTRCSSGMRSIKLLVLPRPTRLVSNINIFQFNDDDDDDSALGDVRKPYPSLALLY